MSEMTDKIVCTMTDAEKLARCEQELHEVQNAIYSERNKLVALLSCLFPSGFSLDESQDVGWRYVVYIDLPSGQVSFHIPDAEFDELFKDLPKYAGQWDGHDSTTKWERVAEFVKGMPPR